MTDVWEEVYDAGRTAWPYIVGFLGLVSVGDMVGWYEGWRSRRGFKITSRIERSSPDVPYQMRIRFDLKGTNKAAINSVLPVIRPRSSIVRWLHGGWSVFGERSRGRPIEATAPSAGESSRGGTGQSYDCAIGVLVGGPSMTTCARSPLFVL